MSHKIEKIIIIILLSCQKDNTLVTPPWNTFFVEHPVYTLFNKLLLLLVNVPNEFTWDPLEYIFILIHVKVIHNLWFIGLSWDCDEMLFQFPGKSLDFAALVENVALWSTICGWDLELNVEGGNRVLSLVGLTAPQVLVIGSMIIFLSLSSNSRALTTPETPEMIKNFIKTWHQFNDVWKYYRENTEYEARNSKIKKKIENNERFRRWWYIILGLMMRYWCSDCLVCILLDFIVVLNENCWIIFFHEIENWLLENNYIEVMIHRILKIQQFLLRIC